jgi:predicted nucleotidyltransferase
MREVSRLAPGTQVVLRAGVRISAERDGTPRKPGYIGEIVQAQDDADETYVVRFSDGVLLSLPRRYLIVRRTLMTAELDMLAPEHVSWTDYVFFRVRIGARAYGLDETDVEDSIRGVYLPPAELQWSLYKPLEQIEQQRPATGGMGTMDEVYWEVEKYLRLGLAANPAVLETLWSPTIVTITELGKELCSIREAFLSRQILNTFTGYAMSQFRKMTRARERGEEPRTRHAMQLIRLLLSGISAARTGELDVIAHDHHTELMAIRTGRMSFEETYAWAVALQRQFEAAMHTTPLPDLPDYETVNKFLIKARAQAVALSAPTPTF